MTDDRQTDHVTEKCVGIGEIACVKAISPNTNWLRERKWHRYCKINAAFCTVLWSYYFWLLRQMLLNEVFPSVVLKHSV